MMVVMGVGGMYFMTKDDSASKKSSATTPAQSINISTDGEVPLTFQMSSATVDLCFIGAPNKVKERNLLDPTWILQQKAVGFGRIDVLGDGTISQPTHVVLPPATGKGYNGNPADFATPQLYRDWNGGVLVQNWSKDFFIHTFRFGRALGVPMDVTLNKRETWKQCKYRIDSTGAQYIKLWSEVRLIKDTSGTWSSYLKWANSMRDSIKKHFGLYSADNPNGKKIIADEPNIFQMDKSSAVWRSNVTPTTLTQIYGGDNYWHMDDQMDFTANMDSNIIRIKYYFDSLMTKQMRTFQTLFPNWKMIAGQVQLEDRDSANTLYITNTCVGDAAWGMFYESFVKNQEFQPKAIQESMRNCSDPESPTTKILTLLNSTLKQGSNVMKLSFTGMPDCSGYALRYGSPQKNHIVVINNLSRATYPLSELWFDTKKKTPTVTAIHHTSLSWRDAIQIDTTVAEIFEIKPGVTVLNYTLK